MPDAAVFDTRYFNQAYYTNSPEEKRWLTEAFTGVKRRVISSVSVHEVYRLALQSEGKDVAKLRASVMVRDFEVVPLDAELAVKSAELRHGHGFSLADGAIAATALREGCPLVSDDFHFTQVAGLKTRWFK